MRRRHGRAAGVGLITVGVLALAMVVQATSAAAVGPGTVLLGTTDSYSVLGGSAVTNTGPSVLSGDLGVSTGSAISGFPPGLVGGAVHQNDAAAGQAQSDLVIAYNDAAGAASSNTVSAPIAGGSLIPGVYTSSSALDVSGNVTLNGQGDPDAVFIFQVGSTLTTASATHILLSNGAQACNVYWQVASSATLGTNTIFVGNILALTSITVTTGTTVQGRALARTGAVTLDDNVFTSPACTTTTTTVTSSPVTATGTTVTAAVVGPVGSATPTGTVTFTVNGVASAPVALDTSGHATLTLPVGATASSRTVTARFNGQQVLLASTSTPVSVAVAAATPVTPVATTPVVATPSTVLASTGTAYTSQLIGSGSAATVLGLLILAVARGRRPRHSG